MTAKEFINLDLQYGDKVRITIKKAKVSRVGFFAGFKTWGNIVTTLNDIPPVFYGPKSDGTMGRQSIFGAGRFTEINYNSIKKIEKI